MYGYPQVPYMGWRYKSPRDKVAEFLDGVMHEVHTRVEWTLDTSRRNWVLLPSRILIEARGLENPAFENVVHSINVQDREFCLESQSDLELIVQRFREVSVPEGLT